LTRNYQADKSYRSLKAFAATRVCAYAAMPDETKSPVPTPPEGEAKPSADKPANPSGEKATVAGSVQSEPKAAAPATAAPPVPVPSGVAPSANEKPAAGAPVALAAPAKPAAPAKTVPVPIPWDSPMVAKLKGQYGSGVESLSYLGQNYLVVDRSTIPDLLRILRDEEQFDYCVDITAAHYPKRDKPFEVIWVLYSFARNERIRVKTLIVEGENVPTSIPVWPTANWLEREVYDMFGIKFDGHPDLKRILLPQEWKGYPLRKDYGILQQDNEWVQINLGIESGQ
jgi:NADH-quinone oxidoreductase subunit C